MEYLLTEPYIRTHKRGLMNQTQRTVPFKSIMIISKQGNALHITWP